MITIRPLRLCNKDIENAGWKDKSIDQLKQEYAAKVEKAKVSEADKKKLLSDHEKSVSKDLARMEKAKASGDTADYKIAEGLVKKSYSLGPSAHKDYKSMVESAKGEKSTKKKETKAGGGHHPDDRKRDKDGKFA